MKYLGQDLHTQEEFDAFKRDYFDPLAAKVERQMFYLKVLAGSFAAGAVAIVIRAIM